MINPNPCSHRFLRRCLSFARVTNPLLVAAAVWCAASLFTARAEDGASLDHPAAPEWKLSDLDGKTVSLSDFKGKVVILDFWATWCAPCRDEIPGFVELQKKYGDRGLVVVGISLDEAGAAFVRKFTQQHGISYPVVLANREVVEAYDGVAALPTTFVIGRDGKIVRGHRGFTPPEAFAEEIAPLL